jgi:copper chaperone
MQTIQLEVTGMTCDHCRRAVEGALTSLDGVTAATADVQSGRADVTYDPARTDVAAMAVAVADEGYALAGPA